MPKKKKIQYIAWFKDLNIKDIPLVGGKNASLGEMYSKLLKKGIKVPNGFALTSDAYWEFLAYNKLDKKIKKILKGLDVKNVRALATAGKKVRDLILKAKFSSQIEKEVIKAYKKLTPLKSPLSKGGSRGVATAVRSSATAEDLPDASFAGQQETYLNIKGEKAILEATKKCIASLFTNRAISYREAKGYDHMNIALSVCVQEMVRSDKSSSGVMFTLDTESGFPGVVLINSAYGLGEYVVKGQVIPDQFFIYKNGLKKGYKSIISKRLGSKEVKLIYAKTGTKQEKVKKSDQNKYSLTDEEILKLAKWGIQIEKHYGHAMDIEWAKDGITGELFIVQARSETVKSQEKKNVIETYHLKNAGKHNKILATGISIGQKIGQGKVRVIENPKDMKYFKPGEVLVTRITDPDWEPIMRIAGAIVTEQGGKTSHAAIVSRELGTPCLVGTKNARKLLKNKKVVTVSCAEGEEGYVYNGSLPFFVESIEVKKMDPTKTKIMMNVGDPDNAFNFASIPSDGVGLAREEFIFSNFIKAHPLAIINYNKLKDKKAKKKIKELTIGYKDKKQYCIDKLAEGIAFIACAFDDKDVILRLSDFKTNEYATLIGGSEFEPKEENPMLGWRGASRYYDPKYKAGFKLECEAIKKVRNEWGLKNVIVMVPFCRTPEEGKQVIKTMKEFGLERGKDGLQVYVMCEIPSNVIQAEEFAQIFDGFSIGSNDLTQLTLGVDRDSALVSHVYDENNLSVKRLIRQVIQVAHKNKCKVGICGQAPSDYPEFAEFLVHEGIDSISLNPDTVLKTRQNILKAEKASGRNKKNIGLAVATKLLLVFGVVGLGLALGGYTCETVNNRAMIEDIKTTFDNQMTDLKTQLKAEIAEELKDQQTKLLNAEYSEDSFAKFSLYYPRIWEVSHGDDSVRFVSGSGKEWFSIKISNKNRNVKTFMEKEFFGLPAKHFKDKDTSSDIEYDVLEIYPNGLDGDVEIELAGDSQNFDKMLGQFTDFTMKK